MLGSFLPPPPPPPLPVGMCLWVGVCVFPSNGMSTGQSFPSIPVSVMELVISCPFFGQKHLPQPPDLGVLDVSSSWRSDSCLMNVYPAAGFSQEAPGSAGDLYSVSRASEALFSCSWECPFSPAPLCPGLPQAYKVRLASLKPVQMDFPPLSPCTGHPIRTEKMQTHLSAQFQRSYINIVA
jgi:hypothetical protein